MAEYQRGQAVLCRTVFAKMSMCKGTWEAPLLDVETTTGAWRGRGTGRGMYLSRVSGMGREMGTGRGQGTAKPLGS